jgi:hypothetical protein
MISSDSELHNLLHLLKCYLLLTYNTAYDSHFGFHGYPYYYIRFEVSAEAEQTAEYRAMDTMITGRDSVRMNSDGFHC